MKVVWSDAALDDFDQLIAYIAERNPAATDRVSTVIDRTARQLGAMQTGRPAGSPGLTKRWSAASLTSSLTPLLMHAMWS